MLGRVKSVGRNRQVAAIGALAACVLLGLVLRSVVLESGVDKAVGAFWKRLLAKDVVAATANLSTAADLDVDSLVSRYAGHVYLGVVKGSIRVEKDIAVVPVQLSSPAAYTVTVLTIMQKEGRDWKVRSISTSR